MSSSGHKHDAFLFAPLDSRKPLTARKVHIRRLYDVLQLCIHRNDLGRATRAWSILARCKEVHWMTMWTTGLLLLGANTDDERRTSQRLDYLHIMMLRHQDEREKILSELVVQLIQSKRHREALDELELYLPSFPYQDNPVLHIHAGLICLYLAQPTTRKTPLPLPADIANTPKEGTSFNAILLREAQSHFEHTLGADPDNAVARGFLEKIPHFFENQQNRPSADGESEDDDSMALDDSPRRKRVRT